MMHGAALYRDIWFDKPPLVPAIYLLWGARIGWALRIAGRSCVGGLRAGLFLASRLGQGAKVTRRRRCSVSS